MPTIHTKEPRMPIAGYSGPSTAHTDWQAHLDAGRLTAAAGPQTAPHIAANRARTEAIVRAHAAATRAALRAATTEGR